MFFFISLHRCLIIEFTEMDKKPNFVGLPFKVDTQYIKNPYPLVAIKADLSLAQNNVIINIATQLQSRIKDYLDNKGKPTERQLSLFADEEFNDNMIQVDIAMSDLCKHACDYSDVEKAAQQMSSILIPVLREDTNGQVYESTAQLMRCWVPKSAGSRRRTGRVIVEMEKCVADSILTMREGFVKHIQNIADICSCRRTPHLYMYLSKWFNMRETYEIEYKELRLLLGVDILGEDQKTIVKSQYKDYKDFCKRILKPIQVELDTLLAEEKVDFTFEFSPKSGTPDKIKFVRVLYKDPIIVKETPKKKASKDDKSWALLAEFAMSQDAKWWDTFSSGFRLETQEDGVLLILIPNSFMMEQINGQPVILAKIKELWKPVDAKYKIVENWDSKQ